MQRGRLLIILAVILGLAVVGIILFIVSQGIGGPQPAEDVTDGPVVDPRPTEIPTVDVIVALQPLPRGAEFVQGSIGPRAWPRNNVPPGAIALESETIGKVAKVQIFQGQPIVRDMLTDSGSGEDASFQIPPGRVAVAYPIDQQSSVAYAIQPGDFVDILTTAFFQDIDEEFQTRLPNKLSFVFTDLAGQEIEEGEGFFVLSQFLDEGRFQLFEGDLPAIVFPSEAQIPRRVAQLTIQSAKIIRIGPWIQAAVPTPAEGEDGEAPVTEDGDGGVDSEESAPSPPSTLPSVVTIAVTPQDALVLLWLRKGSIETEMALRAAGEENADHLTEAVTLQYMLTRFNISVPPKIEFVMAGSVEDIVEDATGQEGDAGVATDAGSGIN